MPRRSYSESERKHTKREIEDKKMLETFIAQLGGVKAVDKAKTLLDEAEDVEAVATYRLDHPYEGDNFWKYSLPRNEEVSAYVNLDVIADDTEITYEGRISDNAYDIFTPPQPREENNECPPSASAETKIGKATD